jgi:tRNA pseudouridine synthase 10
VAGLRVVTRDVARAITDEHGDKTYRVVATCPGGEVFPADAAARAVALTGVVLAQRTPQRVDDRRADLVRTRRIIDVAVEESAPDRMVLRVRTEPGTYVKEFVSGDGGRTEPSLAGVLGVPCVCSELDVLAVGGEPESDAAA